MYQVFVMRHDYVLSFMHMYVCVYICMYDAGN
jgi:hypothetical protein